MRTRTLSLVGAAALVLLAPLGVAGAASPGTLNGHPIALDTSGRIIPWTSTPGDGYGTVVDNAWKYLLNSVPVDPGNGKPAYYSYSYLDPDTQQTVGWPHNPAGLYSMLTESALKYYAYSGNIAVVRLVEGLASWQLAHGMTKTSDDWSFVPYSSGDAGSLTYAGASYGDSTGSGDGAGYLEPDKVGAMGAAWAQLYEFDGNTAYRDAAVAAANALVKHVRTGTATQSPWPFRVAAATGAVREQYTANVIDPIQLFDTLIDLGLGDTAAYRSARQTAWTWLMTYPMRTNVWSNYFEDVPVQSDLTNVNQFVPMMTARYLLQHPDTDPSWQTHVQGLLTWVEQNFGIADNGATTIAEQNAFHYPMGSHTSRYASVQALFAAATSDATAKSKAYYALNWATYMARANGVDIDGPAVNNEWFTDGYADYIRHFLTAMGAFPEWAPDGQTHLTGSTSIVSAVNYATGAVNYRTVDAAATESFKLAFTPTAVTAGGVALPALTTLDRAGWTWDPATKVLRVRHDTSGSVGVSAGGSTGSGTTPPPATTSPTSATTTSTNPSGSTSVISTAPAPWLDSDIGAVGVAGSTTVTGSGDTVQGSGVDIWGTADSFHFYSRSLDGDGQITARVTGLQNTDPWALAGVMLRQSTDPSAPEAIVAVTPGHGVSFTWRPTTGASSSYTSGSAAAAPHWVRLVRAGTSVTAWESADGSSWTRAGAATVSLSGPVLVGLAVTSHDNTRLTTATFDNVSFSTSADTQPPVISGISVGTVNQNGAGVSWTTSEPADAQIQYGKTATYGSATALNTSLTTAHTVVVSGLDAGTTYHFRVLSRDAAGNLATSADQTLTTPANSVATVPTSPPASSTTPTAATDPTTATSSSTPVAPPTTTTTTVSSSAANPVAAPDPVASASADQTTPAGSVTAPAVDPGIAGGVLVAFVAVDGPSAGQAVTAVSGGGLTWTRQAGANHQLGAAEIWTAPVPAGTAPVVVRADYGGSFTSLLWVGAFANVRVGTTAVADGATGAPSVTLLPTAGTSFVWAVGNDWDQAVARVPAGGQSVAHQLLSPSGDTFWVQRIDQAVGMGTGTGSATVADLAPATDRWNLAAVELIPLS